MPAPAILIETAGSNHVLTADSHRAPEAGRRYRQYNSRQSF